jgi:hypothetical protein
MAEREQRTTTTFVVRYPDGSSEFRMNGLVPQAGDLLTGRGRRWLVDEVAEHAAGPVAIVLQRPEPDA